tara:strand:+ start:256 stop:1263 length:1008 start_codon:yes stop_codon:yes gene_type:complete
MNFFVFFSVLFLFTYFVTSICSKKNFLLSFTGDKHQKFTSNLKIPLTGGVVLFLSFIFLELDINTKILCLLFFLLGFISDLKILSSANIRFLIQIILIIFCILLLGLEIKNTRIQILDTLLERNIFNIFFASFCIIIIVNGTNFLDGVNLNVIVYYLLINTVLLYLSFEYKFSLDYESLIFISISLIILTIFNYKNYLFLGDNGSYLLGFFYSIILIDFYDLNQSISPFFIILLLWYPSFEILFSILRKFVLGRSPLKPDNLHLHHLLFNFFKKKFITNNLNKNASGILINLYNLIIIMLSLRDISNTQSQILLIILSVIVYLVTYWKLYNKKFN